MESFAQRDSRQARGLRGQGAGSARSSCRPAETEMPGTVHCLVRALAIAVVALPCQAAEPERVSPRLTLEAAVTLSLRNFPDVRAAEAEVAAAESGIDLAKTAYTPRADMRLGVNRATRNNVFGLLFPNRALPGISGPVQAESTLTSVFGSSAGVLLTYEPFDFGLRRANVRSAEAVKARAEAGRAVAEYEVALAAADAYFRAVANRRAVAAAEANVERMEVFRRSVGALVASELRPGADASRTEAELARSRSDLIRAEREAQMALASLAERLGLAGQALELEPARLLDDPPVEAPPNHLLEAHPLAAEREAAVGVSAARLAALEKAWRPRFQAQSAVYGRGTGALLDGAFLGGSHGLAPSEINWAVGFNVDFDLFEYKRNRAQQRIETHRLEREQARKAAVTQELLGETARAKIAVDAARRIARNAPVELKAAQALETQTRARYKAGLGTVAEVADAQRLLRQAEVDASLAKLGVWRALFALAAAQGTLDELLAATSR